MSDTAYIYTLSDPRKPDAVRYVGVTRTPRLRLKGHINGCKHRTHHAACWIRSLIAADVEPVMNIIETTPAAQWADREQFWISHYTTAGAGLTNSTEGGRGSLGLHNDVRLKMGRTIRLRLLEPAFRSRFSFFQPDTQTKRRAALAASLRGMPEQKRMERMTICHTRVSRQKAAASNRALWAARSIEERRKQTENCRSEELNQRRSDKLKSRLADMTSDEKKARTAAANTPELLEKKRAFMKALRADPEVRRKSAETRRANLAAKKLQSQQALSI